MPQVKPFERYDDMKKKIAMFAGGWGTEILTEYVKGVADRLKDEKADVYLFLSYATYIDEPEIRQGELNIFNLPDMRDFDAALVFGNSIDFEGVFDSIVDRCKEAQIPVITTGRRHEYAYFVGSDNYVGAYELASHLINHHKIKRPFFIAGMNDNPDSNTRLKALKDALAKDGRELDEDSVFESRWEPSLAFNRVHEMYGGDNVNLSNMAKAAIAAKAEKTVQNAAKPGDNSNVELDQLPDAIVCANDSLAMIVSKALKECNVRVPEDVAVTGFDNEYFARVYSPSIASVNQRFFDMGVSTVETLLNLFAGIECDKETIIPSVFVPSESCGCEAGKDVESVRRNLGKERYDDYVATSLFTREMTNYERSLINGEAYEDIVTGFRRAYDTEHIYVGDSMHIVLEPLYKKTIYNSDKKLLTNAYSSRMDVVFSCNKGEFYLNQNFDRRRIVPGNVGEDNEENRLYIILPLHEKANNFGYMILCDEVNLISDYTKIFAFSQRISTTLGKFRQNLCMAYLNKRLLELTETDSLTHVKNRMAFSEIAKEINTNIRVSKKSAFAIAMFDINNLKVINDEFGHDAGDDYIVNCCRLICTSFKRSPVFRLGGDEFAAVLTDEDYECRDELMKELRDKMIKLSENGSISPSEKVSMASGMAAYECDVDKTVEDLLKRADELMYINKAEMKGAKNVR